MMYKIKRYLKEMATDIKEKIQNDPQGNPEAAKKAHGQNRQGHLDGRSRIYHQHRNDLRDHGSIRRFCF